MEQKYILTEETKIFNGCTLHRIKAIRDFDIVHEGDLGGFVETEHNLSHAGNAWVYGNAMVGENAKVYDNAMVYDNALVFGDTKVYDDAMVYDEVMVYGKAEVYGNARVYDKARVHGKAKVYGNVQIYSNACVGDTAKVFGEVIVNGNARVYGDAKVSSMADYIVFKNWWSSGRHFTWTRSNDKWCVGCFYGTGEELIAKAYKDSETSGREYQRIVEYVESIKKN